jgi:hypothetical protein
MLIRRQRHVLDYPSRTCRSLLMRLLSAGMVVGDGVFGKCSAGLLRQAYATLGRYVLEQIAPVVSPPITEKSICTCAMAALAEVDASFDHHGKVSACSMMR